MKQYDPAEAKVWKGVVADYAARARGSAALLEGPLTLEVVFVFPAPPSYPKRIHAKIAAGVEVPKITKPDLKNLVAGIEDGANGVLWKDDVQIWHYGRSRKIYGLRGEVRVTVTEISEQAAPVAAGQAVLGFVR